MKMKRGKTAGPSLIKIIRRVTGPAIFCFFAVLTVTVALAYQVVGEGVEPDNGGSQPPPDRDSVEILPGKTGAHKNETVYVILDHGGNPLEQRIVNRIYQSGDPMAGQIIDYGSYSSVSNLSSPAEPVLEEGRVLWDSALLEEGDIYYEGVTDKSLPVDFKIEYYLDGEPVNGQELAGKSGRLEIVIATTNNLVVDDPVYYREYHGNMVRVNETNYVPLMVQGSLTMDLNRFSNIEAEDVMTIVTGQSMMINFMAFPYPEAKVTLGMDAENIELNNMVFTIIPGLLLVPEVDIENDLLEMVEGVSAIGDGLLRLSDGAGLLLQGLEQFHDQGSGMFAEIEEIIAYLDEFRDFVEAIIEIDLGETIAELVDLLEGILDNIDQFPDPGEFTGHMASLRERTDELTLHSENLDRHAGMLLSTSDLVIAEAYKLVAENEEGSELYVLGMLLLAREEEVRRVAESSASVGQGVAGLDEVTSALQSDWANYYLPGLQAAQDSARQIDQLLGHLLEQLKEYLDQLDRIEDYRGEIMELIETVDEIIAGVAALPQALEQMVQGQRQLRDGMLQLHDRGIIMLKNGLIEGVNEARYGKAKLDLMLTLAGNYRSHADNEHNRNSDVQFIVQTEKIKKQESEASEDNKNSELPVQEETPWERFLDLFKQFGDLPSSEQGSEKRIYRLLPG